MLDWFKKKEKKREIMAWATDDSILEFLRPLIGEDGSLVEAASTLPDDEKADNKIRFVGGLSDAMFGADDSDKAKARIKKMVALIDAISKTGDAQSQSDFYREVTENDSVIGVIDGFLEKLTQSAFAIEPHLYTFAHQLATKTKKRNAVKFGIALLGLCQIEEPIEDLKILGLHDEFTVFSTIALMNLSDDPVQDLWQLAKHVDGWGRIQLVDRLCEMDLPDEIRDWLVYDGFKNSIMYEYLALTCAINGRLDEKLASDAIEPALFESAGDLIGSLLDEGPAEGISGYAEASSTVQNYVRHARNQQLNIRDFNTLTNILNHLEDVLAENGELKHWTKDEVTNTLIDINEVLHSKQWILEIETALNSSDNVEYWNGKTAAQRLGIDISDTLWKRLETNPYDFGSWYDLTSSLKPEFAQTIIDKAIQLLPLEEMSTGPEDSMGLGSNFQKHACLDHLVGFLEGHVGLGEELLLAGLKSPVIRNRNFTLKTLKKWSRENWSKDIVAALEELKEIEPAAETKENVIRLLEGKELKK